MGAREAEEPARGRGRRRRPLGARALRVGAAPRGAAEGAACAARVHASARRMRAEPARRCGGRRGPLGARGGLEPARGRGGRRRPLGARALRVGAAPRGAASNTRTAQNSTACLRASRSPVTASIACYRVVRARAQVYAVHYKCAGHHSNARSAGRHSEARSATEGMTAARSTCTLRAQHVLQRLVTGVRRRGTATAPCTGRWRLGMHGGVW